MINWAKDKEKVELVRRLMAERFASAASVGQKMGCSKNAIIGVCHRNNIPMPGGGYKRPQAHRVSRRPNSTARRHDTVIPQPSAPKPMHGVSHIKVEMQKCAIGEGCKWPIGDVGEPDFHFCDAPRDRDQSYCPEHKALAYIKPNRTAERVVWRNRRIG